MIKADGERQKALKEKLGEAQKALKERRTKVAGLRERMSNATTAAEKADL